MRARVEQLIGDSIRGMWLGTFHSLGARLLRREGEAIGIPPGYTIYDEADRLSAIRNAIRAEGIEPLRAPIRGGTDGSRLSEMGLPTPNIFDGGHEYHSVREWASLHDMAAAAATIVRLAEVWARLGAREVDARVAG